MSDEEDYLSDKFLVETAGASSGSTKTYSQLRKDAEKKAKLKNAQNRIKSRHERELEAREEGLNKSLFDRAKEEEKDGSSGSKGLSIMMKMGFLPGRSLGRPDNNDESKQASQSEALTNTENKPPRIGNPHRTEPLPINEWAGKVGIGTSRKRGLSPTASERVAKMAKMAEDASKEDFRDRSRREYEERRAEGRLGPVQRTCATLDEKAGIFFNVLWLNLGNPNTFPPGLMESLALHTTLDIHLNQEHLDDSLKIQLQKQMKSDALQPISELDVEPIVDNVREFSQDTLEEIQQFLRLQSQDRLKLVVSYLRDRYAYCFWCGTQYESQEDMENECPGPDEEMHD